MSIFIFCILAPFLPPPPNIFYIFNHLFQFQILCLSTMLQSNELFNRNIKNIYWITLSLCENLVPGRLFEVLTGRSPQPLLELLGRIAVLYTLEPICTVVYIVNMNATWEKVMSSLRAQIFHRVLIQKVIFSYSSYAKNLLYCDKSIQFFL